MTEEKRRKLSKEEIEEILKVFAQAKEEAGARITTAILYGENDETEILIDNRKKEDLN